MRRITFSDTMQKGSYTCVEKIGRGFDPLFQPELTPKQMLALGIFGGVYMRDCVDEFPKDWFATARHAPKGEGPQAKYNYFGVIASQPLSVWKKKEWLHESDPRGWFQWYCRYYMGRRMPQEDCRQIKRWHAFKRHKSQVQKYCKKGDPTCRPRQRQALLHWAYDSRNI